MLQAESGTVLSEQPLAKFAELKDRCCQNKIPALHSMERLMRVLLLQERHEQKMLLQTL